MNNKKTKYGLILFAVLIWGLIIYRVGKGMFTADPPLPVIKMAPLPIVDPVVGYELIASEYPDPFGNDLPEDLEEEIDSSTIVPRVTTPLIVEPPPAITYNGYIYNPITKKKTALISFNGRGMTAGINEKIDVNTQVLDITEAKIVVRFNGQKMEVVLSGT